MFNFTPKELATLKKLSTPALIQDFLDRLPINWEKKCETNLSPRNVLKQKKAHCMEGALLAAAALWLHGHPPLLMDLKAHPFDDDHVVALYKINDYWGAISKTNHATLRFRDPVYKTIRELALSYFHEYSLDSDGTKVMQSYSAPFSLKRFGTKWITSEDDVWHIGEALDASRHFPIVPKANKKFIRKSDAMERKAGKLREWK